MADNNTSIIDGISSSPYAQGIENSIMQATGLSQGWADLIVAILIIVLAYLLAKAAKYFIKDIAPGLVSKTQTTLDDHLLKAINGPLQVFIFAMGIFLACATLNSLPGMLEENLAKIMAIVLIYIAAYIVSNVFSALVRWYKEDVAPNMDSRLDNSLLPFVSKVVSVIIFVVATMMAIGALGQDITPLIATLGVGGIAVALAAQELLSNVFGAFAIMSDKPYKIGDRIQLSGNMVGDVVDIGLRSTRIKTLDSRLIIIPNNDISKSSIINYSLPDTRKVLDINVGIAYDSDVEKATRILLDIASHTDGALRDPAPTVYVKDLGNFSINIVMYVWVSDFKLSMDVSDRIYREALKRFKAENIKIPYPVTSVILERPGAVVAEALNPPVKR